MEDRRPGNAQPKYSPYQNEDEGIKYYPLRDGSAAVFWTRCPDRRNSVDFMNVEHPSGLPSDQSRDQQNIMNPNSDGHETNAGAFPLSRLRRRHSLPELATSDLPIQTEVANNALHQDVRNICSTNSYYH